jgi:hypothetical protein
MQSRANQLGESVLGGKAILKLTSPVAGYDAQQPVGVESSAKLCSDATFFWVAERCRLLKAPEQLDSCRRRIDVLATGTSRA